MIVNVAAPKSLKVAGWVEDNPLEINLYLISDFGRKHFKTWEYICAMISSFSQSVNLPLEQSVHWWHHSTLMSWSPLANAPFLNVNLFTQIGLLVSGIWFVLAISTSEMHVAPQISQTATDCHCTDWLKCYEL